MADEQAPAFDQVVPEFGGIGIPANMTPQQKAQFNAAMMRRLKKEKPGTKQPPVTNFIDTAVSWLPLAGAAAGTAALAVGGPVAAALGAGIGGTAGKMAEHAIQSARGKEDIHGASGLLDAVSDSAASGSKDALGTLAVGGAIKGVGAVASKALSGAQSLLEVLGAQDWNKSVKALVVPPLVRAGANAAAKLAGTASKALESKAATGPVLSASERAAQIPLRERLAQIPLQDISEAWTAAKAATPTASIADDVSMVRALVSKGFSQDAAIKVASGGSKDAAAAVKAGWMQSLKAKGAPIPEAALKASGKIPPAVSELMDSPTFKALAASVANRTP